MGARAAGKRAADVPVSIEDILWWCLNGAIAVILFFVRNDLKEIKDELKEGRNRHDNHEIRITRLEVTCKLHHSDTGEHPLRRVSDGLLSQNVGGS